MKKIIGIAAFFVGALLLLTFVLYVSWGFGVIRPTLHIWQTRDVLNVGMAAEVILFCGLIGLLDYLEQRAHDRQQNATKTTIDQSDRLSSIVG